MRGHKFQVTIDVDDQGRKTVGLAGLHLVEGPDGKPQEIKLTREIEVAIVVEAMAVVIEQTLVPKPLEPSGPRILTL